MTEKEKYLDIREKLRNLPPVKASDDFVMKLQRRINLAEAQPSTQLHKEHQEKLERGFFANLFGAGRNTWMVPAIGVTAVVCLVFVWVYVINQNNIFTTNGDNSQTITQSEQNKTGGDDQSLASEKSTGETLKTELPGTEIASDFGYTENDRSLDRGEREGGNTPTDRMMDTRSKDLPEVKMVEEEEKLSKEPPIEKEASPSKGVIKGNENTIIDKTSEKPSMMPGNPEKEIEQPVISDEKEKTGNKNAESDEESDTLKKAKVTEKRISRNIIDQSGLEDLREKVQEEK